MGGAAVSCSNGGALYDVADSAAGMFGVGFEIAGACIAGRSVIFGGGLKDSFSSSS